MELVEATSHARLDERAHKGEQQTNSPQCRRALKYPLSKETILNAHKQRSCYRHVASGNAHFDDLVDGEAFVKLIG
jgi:hypothetical protein